MAGPAIAPKAPCAADAWKDLARKATYTLGITWVLAAAKGQVPKQCIRKLNDEIDALARTIEASVPREAQSDVMVQLCDLLAALQAHAWQFGLHSVGALQAVAWRARARTAADVIDGSERRASIDALPSGCAVPTIAPRRTSSQPSVHALTPPALWPLTRANHPEAQAQIDAPNHKGHVGHFARASKIPIFPERYGPAIMAHIDWPDSWRARFLITPTKQRYVISHTISQGSYGKIRCAIDTATLTPWIIKEFRLTRHAHPDSLSSLGQPRTHPRYEMDIIEELRLAARLSGGLLAPREVMRCGTKVLAVMPKFVGDVKRLMGVVPVEDKRNMMRSVFVQMAQHLQRIHQDDHLHGDVKLENALHTRAGQVLLGDYGGARDCMGRTRYRWPITSSYPAPEMMRGVAYTKRVDTWSLGACLPDFFNPTELNPLALSAYTNDTQACDALTEFAVWRKRIVRGRFVRLNRIDDTTVWGRYFMPLRRREPKLCHFTLKRLLHPNPRRRADISEVVRFCQRNLALMPEPQQAVLALHAYAASRGTQSRVTRGLQRVAWWQGYHGRDGANTSEATSAPVIAPKP